MKNLKRICFLLIAFLIFSLSIGFAALPVILGACLHNWYWLFLYSIHVLSILILAIGCKFAPQHEEDY